MFLLVGAFVGMKSHWSSLSGTKTAESESAWVTSMLAELTATPSNGALKHSAQTIMESAAATILFRFKISHPVKGKIVRYKNERSIN